MSQTGKILKDTEKLEIKNYLYHGIIDWLNYDKDNKRNSFCLEKLESILKTRYLCRPCDFKKFGIKHNDTANPYTYFFTFLSCLPDSQFALTFKKDISQDNGYLVSTSYASFGIIFDASLLNNLKISDIAFCDKEIVIEDNIPLDEYAVGIYINPSKVDKATILAIRNISL